MHHLHAQHPDLPVAVITAHGNTELAVESLKAGAFDFVSKPLDLAVLRKLVHSALALCPQNAAPDPGAALLLGTHPSMVALRALVQRLGRSQAPVHIGGESGTGKELVARQIHLSSARAEAPFVPVNCGAIPPDLMESEFFGHLKGAFTGAVRDKAGFFQAAEGGTLFLDEVADLPLSMQVKLLRALQERQVRPVGAELELPVNVRIISATHQKLDEAVQRGQFRQDLYYRLNVIEVHTPAHGLVSPPPVTPEALAALAAYRFPGNVRELENILERALTLSDGGAIDTHDLQLRHPRAPADVPPVDEPAAAATAPAGEASLDDQVEAIERRAILDALQRARFNKTRAAALLGMSFRALRYRIKKLNIDA